MVVARAIYSASQVDSATVAVSLFSMKSKHRIQLNLHNSLLYYVCHY